MALTQEGIVRVLLAARMRISAAAWLIVRDAQAAEDIFQNVTIKAMTGDARFDREAQLLSWAHVTARHEAMNQLRSRKGHALVLAPTVLELLQADWEGGPHGSEGDRVEALRRCVGSLPGNSRRLLELRYFQARTCTEVALEMGLGLDAVYQRLSRLHRSLRQCIERRLGGGVRVNREAS